VAASASATSSGPRSSMQCVSREGGMDHTLMAMQL
jgi:hypothetical protein